MVSVGQSSSDIRGGVCEHSTVRDGASYALGPSHTTQTLRPVDALHITRLTPRRLLRSIYMMLRPRCFTHHRELATHPPPSLILSQGKRRQTMRDRAEDRATAAVTKAQEGEVLALPAVVKSSHFQRKLTKRLKFSESAQPRPAASNPMERESTAF